MISSTRQYVSNIIPHDLRLDADMTPSAFQRFALSAGQSWHTLHAPQGHGAQL